MIVPRVRHGVGMGLALGIVLLVSGLIVGLDRRFPPPLPDRVDNSFEVVDRHGQMLRVFANRFGRWRLGVDLDDLDPVFVELLIDTEDQRFWDHPGVDVLALVRAGGQWLWHGRVVSGGSTLTMQLARLLEPRERTLGAKLWQIVRAVQLECRLDKREILERYLERAPYGGNLEGVRAASLAYFGKEPHRLSLAESALLIALPQAPEQRRPDRNAPVARAARDRILTRWATSERSSASITVQAVHQARLREVTAQRFELPALAAHATHNAWIRRADRDTIALSIDRAQQIALERLARRTVKDLPAPVSVALLLADARSGEILADVGGPDPLDAQRAGGIDLTRAIRSPGSILKPFIYALAFERGWVAPSTWIDDRPVAFDDYRPRNFDADYLGEVSVREALQKSLNIPAVRLLDALGSAYFLARLRTSGITVVLPEQAPPGLAIALGGLGTTLRDLVQLYTTWPNLGRPIALTDGMSTGTAPTRPLVTPAAAWQVVDILAQIGQASVTNRPIGYKTGTSYGRRDAWAIGFDGRYVLGVWVGRADGGAMPGFSGSHTAAPLLFDAFAAIDVPSTALPSAPAGVRSLSNEQLPFALRRFVQANSLPPVASTVEPSPRIAHPPDHSRIDLGLTNGVDSQTPLVVKILDGRPPFRWLANGQPLPEVLMRRTFHWMPDGAGFARLTVIDALGRTASVALRVE